MFIGHFAVAYILIALFPGIPPLIPLLGVSFPDLLWPVLVFTGIEKVKVDPATPRQVRLVFLSYPYSHALLSGSLISVIPGAIIGFIFGYAAGLIFVAASASHWLLDSLSHNRVLPVLGFEPDTTAGGGLWRFGPATFIIELVFCGAIILLFASPGTVIPLLGVGVLFHLVNANSFFGFSKENPFKTPVPYAIISLFGFFVFIAIADLILSGWWNF